MSSQVRDAEWQRFWRREPARRPLIGAALEVEAPPVRREPVRSQDRIQARRTADDHPHGSELHPGDLDIRGYLRRCDDIHEEARRLESASVWAAAPFQGFPWTEAICGCRIIASGTGSRTSLWAEPPAGTITPRFERWEANEWYGLLLESTEALARHSDGRYPVGLPVLRGPADILSALMTPTGFCLALYDDPALIEEAMDAATEFCLRVYRTSLEVLEAFGHGSVQASRQVAGPEPCVEVQQDAAASLSLEHYERFVAASDRRLAGAAACAFRHLHSKALQHLSLIVRDSGVRAIEITVDDGGPSAESLAGFAETVQQAGKPLVVHGALRPRDVAILASRLDPAGLYLAGRVSSATMGAGFLEAVERELEARGGAKG